MNSRITFPTATAARRLFMAGLAAMFGSSVHAQTVPAPQSGDVFAGFRASDGQGASTSYLIRLGQDNMFRGQPAGTTFDVTGLGGVGADLAALYGPDWHSRSDVQWGLFAVRTGVNSTIYGSRARTSPVTPAAAWPSLTSTARNGTAGAITSVLEEVGGFRNSSAAAHSNAAAVQSNFSGAASYAFQVGTPGTTDFGSLSQWTSIEASFASGAANAVLDFFRIGASVSHVGTFSISPAGVIRFTAPAAIGTADTDGDGFTDAAEALTGTNPADPTDFFRASISVTDSGPRIQTAVAAANQSYRIEYSETLVAGSWTTVAAHSSGPSALPVDFTDTDPGRRARSKGYYRVRTAP